MFSLFALFCCNLSLFFFNFRVVKQRQRGNLNSEDPPEVVVEPQIEEDRSVDNKAAVKTKKKKRKYREIENDQPAEESPPKTSTVIVETILRQVNVDSIPVKSKENKKVELEIPETSHENVPTLETNKNEQKTCEPVPDEAKTSKRKRRRRRSHHKSIPEIVDTPLIMEYLSPPPPKERKHIHFGDQQPADITLVKPQQKQAWSADSVPDKTVHGFQSTSTPLTNGWHPSNSAPQSTVDQFKTKTTPSSNGWLPSANSTPNVPAQFNALLALRQNPAVFSRSCNEKIDSPAMKSVPEPITVEENHSLSEFEPTRYPLCIGPPRTGDIIAYKVISSSPNRL